MDHVRGVQFGHMNLRIKEVVLIVWMVWHGVKNAYCATKAILMGFGVPCYCGCYRCSRSFSARFWFGLGVREWE